MKGEDLQESEAVGYCSEVVYFVQSRPVARMTSQHVCVDIQDLYKVSPDKIEAWADSENPPSPSSY